MGSWPWKLFLKAINFKLTNLKFSENDNLDLCLFIRGVRNRKRVLAWEQRKQADDNWACEIVGFACMQFLIPFFDNRKAPKWRGSRIISLISEDLIPEPSQNKLPKVQKQFVDPQTLRLGKSFQTPFWGSKIFLKGPCSYLRVYNI